MSNIYKCRPSSLLHIEDEYTSYCLDEACAYIMRKIENGEEPNFAVHYSSFSDLYNNL